MPSLVVRARAGDLTAWSQLLPPGWLDRYRGDIRDATATDRRTRAATHRATAMPLSSRRARLAVLAVVGTAAVLGVSTALPPPRERAPVQLPVVPPPATPDLSPAPTATPPTGPSPSPAMSASAGSRRPPARYAVGPRYPRWGYAWMDRARAPYDDEARLDPQWQWSTGRLSRATADRRVTVRHADTGEYTVRIPGAAFTVGIAHVTSFATSGGEYYAPDDEGHSCAVAGYRPSGGDQLVDVRCHANDGDPVDVQFDVFFSAPNAGPGTYATVRYDPPGGSGSRSPVRNSGSVNTTGRDNHVFHEATGRWRAVLPGAAPDGYVHITAYGTGTPARCRPVSTAPTSGGTALSVVVACYAIDRGPVRPVNSPWTLSYVRGAGLHHAASVPAAYAVTAGDPDDPVIDTRRSWASNGETPTISRLGEGRYRVRYRSIGRPDDAPQVTAVGALPRHCRLSWWDSYSDPPRVSIDVNCYDSAGYRADAPFAVAYLRSP